MKKQTLHDLYGIAFILKNSQNYQIVFSRNSQTVSKKCQNQNFGRGRSHNSSAIWEKKMRIGGNVAKICSFFWRKTATSDHSDPCPVGKLPRMTTMPKNY